MRLQSWLTQFQILDSLWDSESLAVLDCNASDQESDLHTPRVSPYETANLDRTTSTFQPQDILGRPTSRGATLGWEHLAASAIT